MMVFGDEFRSWIGRLNDQTILYESEKKQGQVNHSMEAIASNSTKKIKEFNGSSSS
jgi:hypothetical protein